jgi:2-iminobutanoate/2-iminopropanoate deaminase
MNDVIKMRIFMRDMSEYSKMNDIYATCFDGGYPTRFVVGVTELPRNALIEIECTASSDKAPI